MVWASRRHHFADRPDPDRIGPAYPSEARTAKGRLRYYARQFPIVEVDSS
jgi:uncharacterized protein YecE (DUF72 family)